MVERTKTRIILKDLHEKAQVSILNNKYKPKTTVQRLQRDQSIAYNLSSYSAVVYRQKNAQTFACCVHCSDRQILFNILHAVTRVICWWRHRCNKRFYVIFIQVTFFTFL